MFCIESYFKVFVALFNRSVIVICKNMNSSDIERLVPNMALSGCKPNKNGSFDTNSKVRGHCMELRNDVKGNCTGDPNACQALQVNELLKYS